MKNTILLLMCLTIFSISTLATDIKGRVIDLNTRKPVEFATTVLLRADSTYIVGSQTDISGSFLIATQIQKHDYILKASYVGYKTTYIKINNLTANIDVGDIELPGDSKNLNEITITGNRIINKVDRQIILPDSMQLKSSVNGFDLLSNMSLSRLSVDPVNQTIKIGNEEVQLRINGVRSTVQEVVGLRSKDVLRIEYFEDPGVRFGNENVGAVVNFIVDRQKNHGGYISVDGRNAPFVGFGDDNLTIKTNYKASEFSLNYFVNYRSYNDRWNDQTETLNFPNNPIVREQKGTKAPLKYQNHRFNLTYNLTSPDKYVFNVAFKNQIYNYDNTTLYNNIYSGNIGQTFSDSRRKGAEYAPVLDVFYKQDLKSKQSIAFNLVGTYINTNGESEFTEWGQSTPSTSIFNKVDGKKYSIIAEAIYEKQYEKLTFSTGAKHTQGMADNTYTGNSDMKTDMKNAESYAFAQIQGKIADKLGYTLGAGGSRIWFKEGEDDATFYTFRPSLQLNYPVNNNISLKYSFIVNTRTPSLGQLSNVEQQTDSYQISRGNPNLKPYNSYNNKFIINYNKGIFDISSSLGYIYFKNLIVNTYSIEKDKIISHSDNHKYQHYFYWTGDITAKIIKDIWTLNGQFSLSKDVFKSNIGITHNYNGISCALKSNFQYKNYSLVFGLYTRNKNLWGESVYYGEDWNYVEAGYKHKEAKLSLGMSYPFKNYWSAGNKNLSPVKPSTFWSYTEGNGHMLYFRFSWNMSFGRKHKAGEKSLNNADTDKGIL